MFIPQGKGPELMKTGIALLLVVPTLFVAGCGGKPTWTDHASPEGRFSVRVYGTPKTDRVQEPYHQIAFAPEKNVVYSVTYNDLLGETAKKSITEIGAALVGNLKGKLLEGKEVTQHSQEGRELLVEVPDEGFHRIRIFKVGDRYYQVEVSAPTKEAVTSEDANKFFDSFKITG